MPEWTDDRTEPLDDPGYLIFSGGRWHFAPLADSEVVQLEPESILRRATSGLVHSDNERSNLAVDLIEWSEAEGHDAPIGEADASLVMLLWDGHRALAPHAASGSFVVLEAAHVERLWGSGSPSDAGSSTDDVDRSLQMVGLVPAHRDGTG